MPVRIVLIGDGQQDERIGVQQSADVVVVGGGIIGLSVAFYLSQTGIGKVLVVEKERFLGSGSTAKAAGGIRAQFSNDVNIRLSMLSEELFVRFKDDTGWDAHFDQVGYLFLVSTEPDAELFRRHVRLQQSLGLPVEILQPADIPRVAPHVRLDDILFGTFCPTDGLGDPHQFLSGYEAASRARGVSIEPDCLVTSIQTVGGMVSGIITSKGTVATNRVINCAGAFAGQIARMAGSDLPVVPYRRQCVTTGPLDFVQPFFPMVVDVASGLYSHKESKGLLLGWADKSTPPGFDISIDPNYTDAIIERGLSRIPQLETAEIASQWAGLYETTPDHQAIIGWDSMIGGLFHATGFSGHGFMHAPAVGLITAQLLTGKEPAIDIRDLSMSRFSANAIVEETNVI